METMIQYFEWYLPEDGKLYRQISSQAATLARMGFTRLWMPPAFKGYGGRKDVGYGVYDLYDLGEFRQKGTISTKYGTKTQYLKAIKDLQKRGIAALADIVINHKMGADHLEDIQAQTVDAWNRNQVINPLHPVSVWTSYTFPGRNGKYSSFQWNWHHFTGTDYDQKAQKGELLLFEGKHFNNNVSKERGNFDYVMGSDIDFSNDDVRRELYEWGKWYTRFTGINGFRLDSLKSIDSSFFPDWLSAMHWQGNHPDFAVGEFWSGNVWELKDYLNTCRRCMLLMDVPLHYNLYQASTSSGHYDIRQLFHYTLSEIEPYYSCAFVDNHDTQPHQALQSWVMDWFKPQAYASILLYKCKCPCVFYGDLYGIPHDNIQPVPWLKEMVWIRSHLLSPNILDLFDEDTQKACWLSWSDHPILVLYTIADWKSRRFCEPRLASQSLVDITDEKNVANFDEEGWSTFSCRPGSLSIFLCRKDLQAMKKALSPSLLSRVRRA